MTKPDELLQISQVLLERQKVAYQGAISAEVLRRGKVEWMLDRMMDRFFVRLTTEVLAAKILDKNIVVPFERSEQHTPRWLVAGLWPVIIAQTFVGITISSLPLIISAMVLAAIAVILLAVNPPTVATAKGKIEVNYKEFTRFPRATIPLPDELGPGVPYFVIDNYVNYYDD